MSSRVNKAELHRFYFDDPDWLTETVTAQLSVLTTLLLGSMLASPATDDIEVRICGDQNNNCMVTKIQHFHF